MEAQISIHAPSQRATTAQRHRSPFGGFQSTPSTLWDNPSIKSVSPPGHSLDGYQCARPYFDRSFPTDKTEGCRSPGQSSPPKRVETGHIGHCPDCIQTQNFAPSAHNPHRVLPLCEDVCALPRSGYSHQRSPKPTYSPLTSTKTADIPPNPRAKFSRGALPEPRGPIPTPSSPPKTGGEWSPFAVPAKRVCCMYT